MASDTTVFTVHNKSTSEEVTEGGDTIIEGKQVLVVSKPTETVGVTVEAAVGPGAVDAISLTYGDQVVTIPVKFIYALSALLGDIADALPE